MKKRTILAAIAAAALVSIAAGALISQKKDPGANSMALANIEALTQSNEEDECRWLRKEDAYGCIYHKCEVDGTGFLCHCGDITND